MTNEGDNNEHGYSLSSNRPCCHDWGSNQLGQQSAGGGTWLSSDVCISKHVDSVTWLNKSFVLYSALEGEWDLTQVGHTDIFTPSGEGEHSIIVTAKSGESTRYYIPVKGSIVESGGEIMMVSQFAAVYDSAAEQAVSGLLGQRIVEFWEFVSYSAHGTCWTIGHSPGGCVSGKCNKVTGSPCSLTVQTVNGTENYSSDCGNSGFNFSRCPGGDMTINY